MHLKPKHPPRPLVSLLLSLALGCSGSPQESETPEALDSRAQGLASPPGLAPSLVKDLQVGADPYRGSNEKGSWSAKPAPVVVGSVAYFQASDESNGREFWRTDGTPEGTWLVKDLLPGPASSTFRELVAVGDSVYFLLQENGGALWKSDGTAEGTVPVTTAQGPVSSINDLVACNGELFFHGLNDRGSQLWKTNGTAEGTVLLSSAVWFGIYEPDSRPSSLFCANGALYFLGYSRVTFTTELWKTDGTPSGTVKLQSVGSVGWPSTSGATHFTAAGGRVFLNTHGYTHPLWVSDGTPEGTRNLPNVGGQAGTPPPTMMLPIGDRLFFTLSEWGKGTTLWTSDGTPEGTGMFLDLKALSPYPPVVSAVGDTALLSWGDFRLYKSDGTAEGTTQLGNITLVTHSGAGSGLRLPDGRMLFAASNQASWMPWQLWVSDGTQAGTTLFQTAQGQTLTSPGGFRRLGDRVLFWADDGVNGSEPWVTDGTPPGTRMVRDIHRAASSHPKLLTDVEGTLFFTAYDSGNQGRGLWRSDGTAEGTFHLKQLGTGMWAEPLKLTRMGSSLYFFTGSPVLSLWKSDGTAEGTVLVRTLGQGQSASSVDTAVVGSTLFFTAPDSMTGVELWKSDGTAEGTVLVKDIRAGSIGSWPGSLTAVGDVLFFSADNGTHGYELWKSDGTAEGTVLVKDVYPGWIGSMGNARALHAVGGTLFFLAMDNVHGYELWKSDGTAEGTVLVKDVRAGGIGSAAYDLTALGNALFFTADNGIHGRELWKSDGTPAGTVLLKDLAPGSGSAFPAGTLGRASLVHNVGGTLYFAANDRVHGTEPWKSDGTAAGTVLLRDVVPGPQGSGVDTSAFVPVGPHGAFAFAAASGVTGVELWMSDGTSAGTRQLADVARGAMSASPTLLTVSGPRLFFVADEGEHGRELWSVKHAAFKKR
jgi:ELWxxDGT repeat protein